jgi:ketopantoate hydroxymethyltransferase
MSPYLFANGFHLYIRLKSHRLATRGLPVLGTIGFLKISETHGGFRVFEKTEKSQYLCPEIVSLLIWGA